jgi:DNA polymerase-3 subunit alpha
MMAFVQLEDLHGGLEAVFFPKSYASARAALEAGRPILVRGKLERKADGHKLLADTCEPMDDVREKRTRQVDVRLRPDELVDDVLPRLKDLFEKNRGGSVVRIVLDDSVGGFSAQIRLPEQARVAATPRLVDGVRALLGRSDALRLA